jgi:hypothetical protein
MQTDQPHPHHDPEYERPIESRYVDPIDLIWLSTAKELGLTIRRNSEVFGMTEGDGLVHLGDRSTLDPDDCLLQMIFHEICHWITNGVDSAQQRDWGFQLDGPLDPREHACQRLQAHLAGEYGLRDMMGATGDFRQYWDQIPQDPTEPLDQTAWENEVHSFTVAAIKRAQAPPFSAPLNRALQATATIRATTKPFLKHYATEFENDDLPSLWSDERKS